MANKRIDYGRMVETALRTVVRDVISRFAREGVPSPHHFYITFRTGHPGVEIADYLRDRYPTEMTIVLQHQYWDLQVDDDGFSVTLSFNNQPQYLRIPYEAIKVFADPGVEFGLQFTLDDETGEAAPPPLALPSMASPRAIDDRRTTVEGDIPEEGAEIVSLDRFRKK